MTITTLLAYWTDQEIKANKELSDARVALTTAQNELALKSKKLAKANQESVDLVAQIKKIRSDMAEATTPADVHALESNLAKAIGDARARQAEIIEIEAYVDAAQTELNLANARVNSAILRVSTVASALEMDDQDKERIKVGDNQAARISNLVIISNLTGHTFIANDEITIMGMTDSRFDGVFRISAVTDNSIIYPQIGIVVGNGQAERASDSVTISGLTGHPFIVNDKITVTGMSEASFNGIFEISEVTDNSITYPQTEPKASSGGGVIQAHVREGKAVRASGSVTISDLTGHPFIVNDKVTVTGMSEASFNGTFKISEVTGNSITYPQTQADATSGGGLVFLADATSGGGVVLGKRALRLRHKLAEPSFTKLIADVTNVMEKKTWTDANARIEADFPEKLRKCAVARAGGELTRLSNDQKKVVEIDEKAGKINKLLRTRELFKNADAKFRDYVINTKRRFDQALAIAVRIADIKQNPLTEVERLSIYSKKPDGNVDIELEKARNAAAKKRQKLAIAQSNFDTEVMKAEMELLNAWLKALGKDNNADPENDEDVKNAKTALNGLRTELTDGLTGAIKDFFGSSLFSMNDDPDAEKDKPENVSNLVDKLQNDSSLTKLISQFIWGKFDESTRKVLVDPAATLTDRQDKLIKALNDVLVHKSSIFEEQRFKNVVLHPATQSLILQNPTSENLIRLNRLLMEEAYPFEIAKNPLFKPRSQLPDILMEWETAVPDTAWRNLADFQEAERLFTELKEKKPSDLEKAMDDAEKALVISLQEADKNRKKLDLLRNEAKKVTLKASFDTGILPRRLLAALRGDN